jgi:hypothetical protein
MKVISTVFEVTQRGFNVKLTLKRLLGKLQGLASKDIILLLALGLKCEHTLSL